ncbi:MAG: glycosyltransferase [Anaerolineae bacterium]|nr:glycosyltransferase [Anaerolineae bacterium]
MVILHIIRATGLAGAEKHLLTLLPGLREQGVDARLLLWVAPGIPADEIVEAAQACGIPIERWVMPGNGVPRFSGAWFATCAASARPLCIRTWSMPKPMPSRRHGWRASVWW